VKLNLNLLGLVLSSRKAATPFTMDNFAEMTLIVPNLNQFTAGRYFHVSMSPVLRQNLF